MNSYPFRSKLWFESADRRNRYYVTVLYRFGNNDSERFCKIGDLFSGSVCSFTFKVVAVEPRKSVNVNTGEQMEIPGHNKIVFVPAKELAEEVNAPFAMFESIEIPDNALEDPLLSSESESAAQAEEDPLLSSAISDPSESEAQAEEDPLPSSAISDQTVSAAQAEEGPLPSSAISDQTVSAGWHFRRLFRFCHLFILRVCVRSFN